MPADANDDRPYMGVAKQVETLFLQHGDNHKGFGYPKADGFRDRQRVFLEVMRFGPPKPLRPRLLDIGCATGMLFEQLAVGGWDAVDYRGVDLSDTIVEAARKKHPEAEFVVADPFEQPNIWRPQPDYVVMGSIFTWRPGVDRAVMRDYMFRLVRLAFDHCRVGIAFNVMSKHVDWERDDLFHMPFDELAAALRRDVSGSYVFRSDYGLYEYTAYVYR